MCNLATFSYQKCVILPKNDINADFLNLIQMMTEKEKCSLGMMYDANYDTGWSQGEVWRQCIRGDLTVFVYS